MGILLLLLGLLVAASGALKIWRGSRQSSPRSALAVAELVFGAATVLASGVGLSRVRPAAWIAVAILGGLLLASSTAHVKRTLERHRDRQRTEAHRLRAHMGQGNGTGEPSSATDGPLRRS